MSAEAIEVRRREFLAWCEKERIEAAQQLGHFESGILKVGVSGPEGYIDGSDAAMEHLRQIIESMDDLIMKVRADLGYIDGQTGA